MTVPLSVLDLAPISSGSTGRQALRNSLELAMLAEELGFRRYWFAEHHGVPSIASSAPEILISHVACATRRLRVGAGGVMLLNHVPLKVAEQFHTLEALYPGRIDLGIGRAPGTDPLTSRALRPFDPEHFGAQLSELVALSNREFQPDHPFHSVRVVPSDVDLPPIWLLGSSGASAQMAGLAGMGYSFARHFSHTPPGPAVQAYREHFLPSRQFSAPHVIIAVSVICAPTDEEADYLANSAELLWVRLQRNEFLPVPSPREARNHPYSPQDRALIERFRKLVFVGTPDGVRASIEALVLETGADEVMVTTTTYGHEERLRSYRLLAAAMGTGSPPA